MSELNTREEVISELKNMMTKAEITSDNISDDILEKLTTYLELLFEKNKVMNLTAIRDKRGILEKHFIDSLFLMSLVKDTDKSFIDVGTGAGFPGLVLAIVYPDKEFLLVDSVKKKVTFLNEVIEELNLTNVSTSSDRAEELIQSNREKYDVGLCRGVANLRIILEYMIPFLKVKGRFLPQKLTTDEIQESSNALITLHSEILDTHTFTLPECSDKRIIIEIQKLKKTDKKYPRKIGISSKSPL